MPKKKLICPNCSSINAAGILYGYPTEEAMEAAERGDIILGGCCVGLDDPKYGCKDCGYEWGGGKSTWLYEVKTVKASVGGFFGPSYSVEINNEKRLLVYHAAEGGVSSKEKELTLTTEDWNTLIKGLISTEFEYWLDTYLDLHVMDGTSWHVEVELESGQSIEKSGSNQYPGRWMQFCRMISSLTGEKFS